MEEFGAENSVLFSAVTSAGVRDVWSWIERTVAPSEVLGEA
jgi:hypothetical protein